MEQLRICVAFPPRHFLHLLKREPTPYTHFFHPGKSVEKVNIASRQRKAGKSIASSLDYLSTVSTPTPRLVHMYLPYEPCNAPSRKQSCTRSGVASFEQRYFSVARHRLIRNTEKLSRPPCLAEACVLVHGVTCPQAAFRSE